MTEAQSQYFMAKSEELDGMTLSVFFAPEGQGFIVPKEVVRAKSQDPSRAHTMWHIIRGDLHAHDDELATSIEPSTIGKVQDDLDKFLRTQPADELVIDDDAPDEVKQALQSIEQGIRQDASPVRFADVLGLVILDGREDNTEPSTGLYL